MNDTSQNPTKMLLHACCGPCSLEPVRLLREDGVEPTVFYANSNIHPDEEYAHRMETLRTWAQDETLSVIEGAYDPASWEAVVGKIGDAAREKHGIIANGPEGHSAEAEAARQARCRACYRLRFEEAADYAAAHGFNTLGTTLSVSPYQYTEVIREELERAAARAGINARFEDYRPYYDEATRRSREASMYRQNYCGCRFSDEEAAFERAERKRQRQEAKAAEQEAHAAEHAAEEEARQAKKAERAAYNDKQARKRAVLKAMRAQNKE